MPGQLTRVNSRAALRGFTLAEILVSIAVLTLFVALVARLLSSATIITTLGGKRMNSDNQARPILDRMAEDFSQIVKRTDVDYYLKVDSTSYPSYPTQTGNDQIAFYSQVEGYSHATQQSHFSLVAYRVNSNPASPAYNKLERLGKGLIWNGQPTPTPAPSPTPTVVPMVFLPIPLASPLPSPLPSPMPSPYPTPAWPQVASMAADPDYEVIGPQVFRFEYYYQLQSGNLNDSPWDDLAGGQGHSTISGLRDVGAIVVLIATIDPKSRALVTDAQLTTLAGQMNDYVAPLKPPKPKATVSPQWQWQQAVNLNLAALPKAAIAGIRIYQRYFYLNGEAQ
jgi:prepilin-type N-terminal cleavage/methylation domain-containing protein